jgi:protein phosphatase
MINLNRLLKLSTDKSSQENVFGATDIGKMRENNEDYFLVEKEKQLYIVSDGMGGHNAGEVASLNATNTVKEYFTNQRLAEVKKDPKLIRGEIVNSIKKAHHHILDMSAQNPDYKGMGCTIVVALIIDDMLHLGHIGDSRAYLADEKSITLLTTDHTYVMQLVKAGKMKMDEIRESNIKNHLSQALGAPITLIPDYGKQQLNQGDRVLICTDGLWDLISDREIYNLLIQNKSKEQICKDFIRKANKKGGLDNITLIVIEYQPSDHVKSGEKPETSGAGEYGIVFSLPDNDDSN